MAERYFAPFLFPGEGRGPGQRGSAAVAAPWAPAFAGERQEGEFGVYLVADGTNKPYRCKIRPTAFSHLQAMDFMMKGHMLADTTAVLSAIDVVFGECDR